jgi:hypothetical protein
VRSYRPDFDPNDLVGRNMDFFHRTAAHQRRNVADASRMPCSAAFELDYARLVLWYSPSVTRP